MDGAEVLIGNADGVGREPDPAGVHTFADVCAGGCTPAPLEGEMGPAMAGLLMGCWMTKLVSSRLMPDFQSVRKMLCRKHNGT